MFAVTYNKKEKDILKVKNYITTLFVLVTANKIKTKLKFLKEKKVVCFAVHNNESRIATVILFDFFPFTNYDFIFRCSLSLTTKKVVVNFLLLTGLDKKTFILAITS